MPQIVEPQVRDLRRLGAAAPVAFQIVLGDGEHAAVDGAREGGQRSDGGGGQWHVAAVAVLGVVQAQLRCHCT